MYLLLMFEWLQIYLKTWWLDKLLSFDVMQFFWIINFYFIWLLRKYAYYAM